jgi:hypothetical protein
MLHAGTGLGRDAQHVVGIASDDVGELVGVLLRLRAREVDLVEHRDDLQFGLEREVEVGERLGLDALRGVDQQDRSLARLEAAAHLVREVDVAGGVDEVQDVRRTGVVTGGLVERQSYGLALDGDAALALDVHAVEVLRTHVTPVDDAGVLEHPVGEGGLAVVDVRDDAEVADQCRVGRAGPRCRIRGLAHGGHILPCGR